MVYVIDRTSSGKYLLRRFEHEYPYSFENDIILDEDIVLMAKGIDSTIHAIKLIGAEYYWIHLKPNGKCEREVRLYDLVDPLSIASDGIMIYLIGQFTDGRYMIICDGYRGTIQSEPRMFVDPQYVTISGLRVLVLDNDDGYKVKTWHGKWSGNLRTLD